MGNAHLCRLLISAEFEHVTELMSTRVDYRIPDSRYGAIAKKGNDLLDFCSAQDPSGALLISRSFGKRCWTTIPISTFRRWNRALFSKNCSSMGPN